MIETVCIHNDFMSEHVYTHDNFMSEHVYAHDDFMSEHIYTRDDYRNNTFYFFQFELCLINFISHKNKMNMKNLNVSHNI